MEVNWRLAWVIRAQWGSVVRHWSSMGNIRAPQGSMRSYWGSVGVIGNHWQSVEVIAAWWRPLQLSGALLGSWGSVGLIVDSIGLIGTQWSSVGLSRDQCAMYVYSSVAAGFSVWVHWTFNVCSLTEAIDHSHTTEGWEFQFLFNVSNQINMGHVLIHTMKLE